MAAAGRQLIGDSRSFFAADRDLEAAGARIEEILIAGLVDPAYGSIALAFMEDSLID